MSVMALGEKKVSPETWDLTAVLSEISDHPLSSQSETEDSKGFIRV